ncbi:MAG: polyphosphate kinase 1 [Pyrinomonadaceae bacterium]|nr:polyphosphate kinase 1 [Pyrinomonadaceae bacterium]
MAKPVHQLALIDRQQGPSATVPAAAQARFINRDLSLLEFYSNVLDEALDSSNPLLERLKFLAIFASNLDEFFMIRVSGLKEKLGTRSEVSPDGYSRPELLTEIRKKVVRLSAIHANCLNREVIPALADCGIALESYSQLHPAERSELDKYFDDHIAAVLTPQAVDPTHPFPYISGGTLNIGLSIRPRLTKRVARAFAKIGDEFFVRIEIPEFLQRFVPAGEGDSRFVLIEEIVIANISKIVPIEERADCSVFRITRDGDLELRESETEDLLETMEENLKERRFGDVIRLEVSQSMPRSTVDYLVRSLNIESDDVYEVEGPLKSVDLWKIANLNRPDLKEAPIHSQIPDRLKSDESIFDIIKQGDVLLHHPFNPYSTVTEMIREAADDPDVLAIKMCLYRIGEDSPIAPLLIRASENGKQVTALVEIKARFDEAKNIEWGRRLEEAGVHVVYGLLGLKTHAKTTLIVRREDDRLKRYVHLATGNYNPATSTVYTDLGLLTCAESIAEDVSNLFNYLTVYHEPKHINKSLIAPINLRQRMFEMIDREIDHARLGRKARIIAKINRLADQDIVNRLCEASQAGVEIDLIVRGVCTLRPGIPGLSDRIRVRSIVGRLLEHSRVYFFENGGDHQVYIGSSDWMPRNLDRRVEVVVPVDDPQLRDFLKEEYLPSYLRDNVKARVLQPDGTYLKPEAAGEKFDAQLSFQSKNNTLGHIGRAPLETNFGGTGT